MYSTLSNEGQLNITIVIQKLILHFRVKTKA